MTVQGRIHNGVVIFDGQPDIPEGTPVTVLFEPEQNLTKPRSESMSVEERGRILGIIKRIASLPNENPGDTFSGADHDQVLYGEP